MNNLIDQEPITFNGLIKYIKNNYIRFIVVNSNLFYYMNSEDAVSSFTEDGVFLHSELRGVDVEILISDYLLEDDQVLLFQRRAVGTKAELFIIDKGENV